MMGHMGDSVSFKFTSGMNSGMSVEVSRQIALLTVMEII
jgi:hypothetical protein